MSTSGKYSYHWDRFGIDGAIYRYDDAPHKAWVHVTTFLHHFHSGGEKKVIESDMDIKPEAQIKKFMDFVYKTRLKII